MNSRDKLGAVLAGRLHALVRNLPSARRGQPEALHRARVASRRMREVLPVLETTVPEDRFRKTRRTTRRLTRALGQVRELDVSLALLDGLGVRGEPERLAITRLRAALRRKRESTRARMRRRLEALRPEKLIRKLKAQTEPDGRPAPAEWRPLLAARIRGRAARVRHTIAHAGAIYLPDRVHAVRVALKKLRYALEFVDETGVAAVKQTIRTLKQAQDILGQLHDREVLIGAIRAERADLAHSNGLHQDADYDPLVARLEAECRVLHARYISRRNRLLAACDGIDELVRRLMKASRLRSPRGRATRGTRQAVV